MENEHTSEMPTTQAKEPKFGKDALLIAGSILLSSLIIAVSMMAVLKVPAGTSAIDAETQNVPLPGEPESTDASTTIDDDPVLGDKKKAKVAIVEFSDFECPFCQRFHKETFDDLVKEYVDTGKAVMVSRDFPLSFHEPNASKEAGLANCVAKQKGDKAYFTFTQGVYENTLSNGQGLPAGKLDGLLRQVGANASSVNTCAETDAVKEEIKKDIASGQEAGVSGTPSFIIGTLDADGNVTGERVVGALPIDGFKAVIDKYLQ